MSFQTSQPIILLSASVLSMPIDESLQSMLIMAKRPIGFGFAYATTPWYTNEGLQNCFTEAGFLSLGCMATFLVMIFVGNRLCSFSASTQWDYVGSSSLSGDQ